MKKLQLLILFFFFSSDMDAQINPLFDFYVNCDGLTVNFYDQSISNGNIDNWLWNFDDGNTSTWQNPTLTYSTPGTYNVCLTVSDDLGETEMICNFVTVMNSNDPVCIIDPNIPILSCASNGPQSIVLDGSQSSSGPNYTYQWTTQNGNILFDTENVQNPIIGASGNYTLVVTNNLNGCTASSTVTVTGDSSYPVANVQQSGVISCSNPTVTLDGSASSPSPDYTYSWKLGNTTISTEHTITVSTVGIYEFQVALAGSSWCSVSNFVEVVSDGSGPNINLPVTTFNDTIYTCMEDIFYSADLVDANCSNCSIEIRDANDSLMTTSLPWAFMIGSQLPYWPEHPFSLIVTDNDSGCSNSVFLPVPQGNTSSFQPNKTNESCPGAADGSITPTFTGNASPYTFDWLDLPGTDNPLNRDNLTEGVYSLIITNAVGCQVFGFGTGGAIEVEIKSLPIANVDKTENDLTCNDTPPFTLDGSFSSNGSSLTFEWFDINGNFIGNTEVLEVNDVSIDYVLVVTDTNTGCQNSDTLIWIQGALPVADAGPDQELTCDVTFVYLDASNSSAGPNINYQWKFNNVIIGSGTTIPASQPGVYTLTVSNGSGCTAMDQVTVTQNSNLPTFSTSSNLVCPGDLVTVQLGPDCMNCSFELVDAIGNPQCQSSFPCLIDPADGPFTITITDNITGCQNIETFSISVSDPIIFENLGITNASCFGELDGEIWPLISGGTQPYNYSWSTGDFTQSISNLAAGTYQLTVTDVNGCQEVETFTILEPTPVEIIDAEITNASCIGSDGSISLTVTGGNPGYTETWNPAIGTGQTITNLAAGTYQVTITDINGCTAANEFIVLEEDCLTVTNDTTICQGESIQLNAFIDDPSMFTFEWTPTTDLDDPLNQNPIALPVETTTYCVTATNIISGIFETKCVTINVQNYLDFDLLDFSNAPLCEGDTLELYSNLGNTFQWGSFTGWSSTDPNPTIPDVIQFDHSGTYFLEITDEFGCTASTQFDVFVDDDCVWPGDTDTNLVVNHFDLLNIGLAFDSTGAVRQGASFDWIGQPAEDWSQSTPNTSVNYKHIDTDGNGIINSEDTLAITQNFGLTHNFNTDVVLNQFNNLPVVSDGVLTSPFYVEPDTLVEGETIGLDIILGDASNVVTGLYGIGFSIEYDTAVIVPGSASIDFSNSWLGDVDADAISIQFDFPSPGRIDAAITRIDGIEMDGFGIFGELIITLEDDILLWDPNGEVNFGPNDVMVEFSITNYHLINFSQEEILVNAVNTTAIVDGTTSLSDVELDQLIEVYPNPAKELFYVASKDLEVERVRIFSSTGELKGLKKTQDEVSEFSTKEFPSGIYFIEIQTLEGVITKKLSVIK